MARVDYYHSFVTAAPPQPPLQLLRITCSSRMIQHFAIWFFILLNNSAPIAAE
jgi:hypothetical protein